MKDWTWYILYILAIIGNLWAIYEGLYVEATYCVAWMIFVEIKLWRAENSDR